MKLTHKHVGAALLALCAVLGVGFAYVTCKFNSGSIFLDILLPPPALPSHAGSPQMRQRRRGMLNPGQPRQMGIPGGPNQNGQMGNPASCT